ncbi:MAG TPA: hypothetical protein PKM73_18825 [Verrucomicrobiota bacterium]|nr:hypothetical protein [Verrucomicrobiota bacterium]HNU52606.1 hypothetical protein [Verrucomicrobiota bacterium]
MKRFYPTLGWAVVATAAAWVLTSGSVRADIIADSQAEFSGTQGDQGWLYGYRDVTADGKGIDYDPAADFLPFDEWAWTGGAWDPNTAGGAPWTYVGAVDLHPNGPNSGGHQWAVRRWTAAELTGLTALAITWHTHKSGTCGNGVTGAIHVNGIRMDGSVVAAADTVGVTRTYYLNANPTDSIDLILSPTGTHGNDDGGYENDWCDGSVNWMRIDTTIPDNPRQPDGSIFIPAGADDTDADGLPDVWENAYFPGDLTKLTRTGDYDGDGLLDPAELQRNSDPTNQDTDDDGLKDNAETGTGVYASPQDAGTQVRNADTDADGRKDGEEVLGTPTSNPVVWDTDGDTYGDGEEVATGHDPNDPDHNPLTTQIANSEAEFSGTQGDQGWFSGYRNYTESGPDLNYNPDTAFLPFDETMWEGNSWNLDPGTAAPWTTMAALDTHPNGQNNGDVHWTVRRWVAVELTDTTPLALQYFVRKGNTGCGNGVTAAVFRNGMLIDQVAIAGNDGIGTTRTCYANVAVGDAIDLILSPRGADGFDTDGCDGSQFRLVISTAIPPNPRQPDGTVFIPVGAGDSDADTMPDLWEEIYFPGDLTKLTLTGDFDADGLKDPDEYARDSDPTRPDTDGDGLGDLVETGTGVFVSPTATGTSPRKADTDGDGRTDREEIEEPPTTNPNKADTDGDGFTDTEEIASGTDPNNAGDNVLTFVIANSQAEFSGVQGQNGWFNGFRNVTQDGKGTDYDPAVDFIPYLGGEGWGTWDGWTQLWTGSAWDMEILGQGPWTWQAPLGIHPNGANSEPYFEEHWAIRRWVASELAQTTPVALIWFARKDNTSDDGVTGTLHINGIQVDSRVVPGNDTTGEIRRYYANLKPTDIVDLGLTPHGVSTANDYSDASVTWFWVDTRLPREPRQPDGTLFIPDGAGDADGDGLLDFWELIYADALTTLNGTGDNDGDGLSNTVEFQRDTNPLAVDTDGDGLADPTETNTGVFVDPANAGSHPRKTDTDADGRTDGEEVNGTPKTDPTKADTDGDTFSDGSELATGHNPNDPADNPNTTWIADSFLEFSGTQGQENWFSGYRDPKADGGGVNYNPDTAFIAFDESVWTGTMWDLAAGVNPWTELGPENTHPNGINNGVVHWTLRRWVALEITKTTPLQLRWSMRKTNTGGGNGVTGALYINGQLQDQAVIAYNNGTGLTRTFFANVNPNDRIDLILSPTGTDAADTDGADGSANRLVIDTAIPPNPRQPDGTPFVPAGQETITVLRPQAAGGKVTLTWNSVAGSTYTVFGSKDLETWSPLQAGIASGGEQTQYVDSTPDPAARFYRVGQD